MRKIVPVLAMLFALASSPGHALPCLVAPFFDVPAPDNTCSSIEWLKNRQVTLGCTNDLYCPGSFVTRAQMALFMNRLADAIVPPPVVADVNIGATTIPIVTAGSVGAVPCSALLPAVSYPRTLVATGRGSFRMAMAAGDISMRMVYTLDGDTSNYLVATTSIQRTTATPSSWGHVSHSAVILVPPQASVKVGTAFVSAGGSVAASDASCQITGIIQSRTGTMTPFDGAF